MSEFTDSSNRCRAQFKCAQRVIGQRFGGNGPNGLSYYYYYYYAYYYYHYYYYTTTNAIRRGANPGKDRFELL